jgi:hypothetical protein
MNKPRTSRPAPANYGPEPIYQPNGPISPLFMTEAVRTLMRALPLDDAEPEAWRNRRQRCAMIALAGLNPRDPTEVMIGVQALCAYHAATNLWFLGMNFRRPAGGNIRYTAAAASTARTFDSLLKALERRQAKPIPPPQDPPPPRDWDEIPPAEVVTAWSGRCAGTNDNLPEDPTKWTRPLFEAARPYLDQAREDYDNQGLDLENTPGILPGGGMIIPANPTEAQQAYLARRYAMMIRRMYRENLAKGIDAYPVPPTVRTGDLLE